MMRRWMQQLPRWQEWRQWRTAQNQNQTWVCSTKIFSTTTTSAATTAIERVLVKHCGCQLEMRDAIHFLRPVAPSNGRILRRKSAAIAPAGNFIKQSRHRKGHCEHAYAAMHSEWKCPALFYLRRSLTQLLLPATHKPSQSTVLLPKEAHMFMGGCGGGGHGACACLLAKVQTLVAVLEAPAGCPQEPSPREGRPDAPDLSGRPRCRYQSWSWSCCWLNLNRSARRCAWHASVSFSLISFAQIQRLAFLRPQVPSCTPAHGTFHAACGSSQSPAEGISPRPQCPPQL